jgi:hypothetical protein
MPIMTVSSTAKLRFGQSFSLVDLTSLANQSILQLVLLGAMAVIILSLLPSNNISIVFYCFWGQGIGFAAGIISVIFILISINTQINELQTIKTSPEFGSHFLTYSYSLSVICLILEWREVKKLRTAKSINRTTKMNSLANINQQPVENMVSAALKSDSRKEDIRGGFSNSVIPITINNFTIVRSSENDFQLLDIKNFRQHASLRFSLGLGLFKTGKTVVESM